MTFLILQRQLANDSGVLIPGRYVLQAVDKLERLVTLEWCGTQWTITSECLEQLLASGDADLTQEA